MESSEPGNHGDVVIQSIVARFAEAFRSGEKPTIDSYLSEYEGESKEALLRDLIAVEIKHRRDSDEVVTPDKYIDVFPEHASTIRAWFRSYSGVGSGQFDGSTVGIDQAIGSLSQTAAEPVRRLGRYELRGIVGRGAFGEVWHAYDPELRRDVALKTPRDDMQVSRELRRQFVAEGRKAARLRHPGIVRVYDAGEDQGRCFIVSELIHGGTLKRLVKGESLPFERTIEIVRRVAEALDYAHRNGVIHRDIKPSNILLDAEDSPHISDFGLAKIESAEGSIADRGSVVGTPAYMSPEQAAGRADLADGRTDTYSLGVVLFELLTHRRPFSASSMAQLLERIQAGEHEPLQREGVEIPEDLQHVCLTAMALRQEDRYATSGDFAEALGGLLQTDGEPAKGQSTRWYQAAWVTTGLLLITILLAAWAIVPALSPRPANSVPVRIATDPPNASITFVPLDASTGRPSPEGARKGARRRARSWLIPGRYLVVAVLDDQRFHEVYRTVPSPDDDRCAGPHWHLYWTRGDDGTVELPVVEIPPSSVAEDLIRFGGAESVGLGAVSTDAPPTHWAMVPAFLAAPRKVDRHMFTTQIGLDKLPSRFRSQPEKVREPFEQRAAPLTFVSWEEATHFAERAGMRLLDEIEFEFAARQFLQRPLSDRASGDWLIAPAEWTCNSAYAFPLGPARQTLATSADDRVVRGLKQSPGTTVDEDEITKVVNARFFLDQRHCTAHIGFRFARSPHPRLRAADFVTFKETSTR